MDLFSKYKNNQTLTVTPYGIAQELITTYNLESPWNNNVYFGEATLDVLSHSTLDDVSADLEGIIRALYYLNRKIEASRKTISFWDAYQIKDTIDNRDLALGQLTRLPANASIVSNLRDPFIYGGDQTVYRGDILVKDYEEQIHLIHTLSTGFYKPINITGASNTYQITYKFENSQSTPVPLNLNVTETQSGYNIQFSLQPGAGHNFSSNGNTATPIIKSFGVFEDSAHNIYYEQLLLDDVVSVAGTDTSRTFYVNNDTCINILYEVK